MAISPDRSLPADGRPRQLGMAVRIAADQECPPSLENDLKADSRSPSSRM